MDAVDFSVDVDALRELTRQLETVRESLTIVRPPGLYSGAIASNHVNDALDAFEREVSRSKEEVLGNVNVAIAALSAAVERYEQNEHAIVGGLRDSLR